RAQQPPGLEALDELAGRPLDALGPSQRLSVAHGAARRGRQRSLASGSAGAHLAQGGHTLASMTVLLDEMQERVSRVGGDAPFEPALDARHVARDQEQSRDRERPRQLARLEQPQQPLELPHVLPAETHFHLPYT